MWQDISLSHIQPKSHCGHNASTISKLIGKHNSRYFWKQFINASDVRLGGYVNTVCVAVVCNFDQRKKETERLLVGERESWEGRGGERVTEWADERESQAAAETQRYRLKKHRKMKGAETWEQVRGGWNSNTEEKNRKVREQQQNIEKQEGRRSGWRDGFPKRYLRKGSAELPVRFGGSSSHTVQIIKCAL